MMEFRPTRGGFLRAFGCAQFIIPFLKGEGPFGSTSIDPERGAPQRDIFREYKEALRREQAEALVAQEEERRGKRGIPPLTIAEADELLTHYIDRLPLRSTRMRYHSFLSYFGLLKRLGWVEATGEQELSDAQVLMSLETGEEPRGTGQPRIYYRLTSAGYSAPEHLISDPVTAFYNYPKNLRSGKPKPKAKAKPRRGKAKL